MLIVTLVFLMLAALLPNHSAHAGDQSVPGGGADDAIAIASKSPLVQSAFKIIVTRAKQIRDRRLRAITLDAIDNPRTCVKHRAALSLAAKQAIIANLLSSRLVDPDDDKSFPGGLMAGIFPPLLNDGGPCPNPPEPFWASAGSVFHGHHSYPGGLAVHETVNDMNFDALANDYRRVFGNLNANGLPVVNPSDNSGAEKDQLIDQDIVIAAPLWHDWAKLIVFQWNADGSEFQELNFGGNGKTDDWGHPGDSRTGAHHVLGIAEAMARGLPPLFVIAQASAHATPGLGNEYKVVNWVRAAAIIARIDPVASGYLFKDSSGNLRLPPLRRLGDMDLISESPKESNLMAEYALHNLSDGDFVFSVPSVPSSEFILQRLAPEFGINPDSPDYNVSYRNPVLAFLSPERLMMVYGGGGTEAVRAEIRLLKRIGILPFNRLSLISTPFEPALQDPDDLPAINARL